VRTVRPVRCFVTSRRAILWRHNMVPFNGAILWHVCTRLNQLAPMSTCSTNQLAPLVDQLAPGKYGANWYRVVLGDSAEKKTIRLDSKIISIRFDEIVLCLFAFAWTHLHHHVASLTMAINFLIDFLHTYYTFLSMLDYKFLFNYPRFWRSYAILSAITQFT